MNDDSVVLNSCRCCLEPKTDCTDVFTTLDEFQNKICDLLLDCAGIVISEHDCFSKQICSPCLGDLYNATQFRMRCLKSEEVLQNKQLLAATLNSVLRGNTVSTESNINAVIQSTQSDSFESRVNQDLFASGLSFLQSSSEMEKSIVVLDLESNLLSVNMGNEIVNLNDANPPIVQPEACSSSVNNLQCNICNEEFDDSETLHCHIRTHSENTRNALNCYICNRKFDSLAILLRHRRVSHTARSFKCFICIQIFSRHSSLIEHMDVHASAYPHKCNLCEKRFKFSNSLQKHEASHVSDVDGEPYISHEQLKKHSISSPSRDTNRKSSRNISPMCDVCGRVFSRIFSLQRHRRIHNGNCLFRCELCNRTFNTKYDFNAHCKRHSDEKLFKCHLCDQKFKSAYLQKRHILWHNTVQQPGDNLFKCNVCDQEFSSSQLHKQHIQSHISELQVQHNNTRKIFTCDICGSFFCSMFSLKRHRSLHTGVLQYKCDICAASYSRRYELYAHSLCHQKETHVTELSSKSNLDEQSNACDTQNQTDDDKMMEDPEVSSVSTTKQTLQCSICEEKCDDDDALQRHIQIHSKDTTDALKCYICDRQFQTTKILTLHRRLHHTQRLGAKFNRRSGLHFSERPHECDLCNKRFKFKNSLQKHKISHSEERTHVCDICGESYMSSDQLKEHKTQHSESVHITSQNSEQENVDTGKTSDADEDNPIATGENPRVCDTGDLPYKCKTCERKFNTKYNFDLHRQRHCNDKQFKCHLCKQEFKTLQLHKQHILWHKSKRMSGRKKFKCRICDHEFRSAYLRRQHMRSHVMIVSSESNAGETPSIDGTEKSSVDDKPSVETTTSGVSIIKQTLYGEECDDNDTFHQRIQEEHSEETKDARKVLIRYQRLHNKQRLIRCPMCDKRFSRRSVLIKHMLIHSSERSHKCDLCDKRFKFESSLQKHYITHNDEGSNVRDVGGEKPYADSDQLRDHETQMSNNCDDHITSYTLKQEITVNEVEIDDVYEESYIDNDQPKEHKIEHPEIPPHSGDIQITSPKQDTNANAEETTDTDKNNGTAGTSDNTYNMCDVCGHVFSRISSLNRHRRLHTGNLPYKCEICERMFNTNYEFKLHWQQHSNERMFKCRPCKQAFKTARLYKRHMLCHKTDPQSTLGEKAYKCDICDQAFSAARLHKRHMRLHAPGPAPRKSHTCDICGSIFTTMFSLKRHRSLHTGILPYKCEICNISFQKKYELEAHWECHPGEQPYKCFLCDKGFRTSYYYTRHIQAHGTGLLTESNRDEESSTRDIQQPAKNLQCSICDKKFKTATRLTRHYYFHSIRRIVKCTMCDMRFSHQSALAKHMISHSNERKHKCDLCFKRFKFKHTLQQHKTTHSNESQQEPNLNSENTSIPNQEINTAGSRDNSVTCDICGYVFSRVYSLIRHRRLHTGNLPFKCETCDRMFNSRYEYTKHSQHHLNEKFNKRLRSGRSLTRNIRARNTTLPSKNEKGLFQCRICDREFSTVSLYNQHARSHVQNNVQTKLHPCDICGFFFSTMFSLKRHRALHTGILPFKCVICDVSFMKKYELEAHLESHPDEYPFKCAHCGKGSRTVYYHRQHIRSHVTEPSAESGTDEKPNTCGDIQQLSDDNDTKEKIENPSVSIVEQTTPERSIDVEECDGRNADCHIRKNSEDSAKTANLLHQHHPQRMFRCSKCDKRFSRRSVLGKHMIFHSYERKHKCDMCNKRFKFRSSLRNHKIAHNGERPHVCDVCGESYLNSDQLEDHKAQHSHSIKQESIVIVEETHNTDLNIGATGASENSPMCDICGRVFSTLFSLKRHRRLHTGNLPYKCEICDRMFNSNYAFKLHSGRHSHEKQYKCQLCGEAFPNAKLYKWHMRSHNRIVPPKTEKTAFKCSICDQEFRAAYLHKQHLKVHVVEKRIHENIQPKLHPCDICGCLFTTMFSLKRHHSLHTGILMFKCDVCNESFHKKYELEAHWESHPNEKPFKCTVCDKSFVTVTSYKQHIQSHVQKPPVKKSTEKKRPICDLCGAVFTRDFSLRRHYQLHLKNKDLLTTIDSSSVENHKKQQQPN